MNIQMGTVVRVQIGTSMLLLAGLRDCKLFVMFMLSDEVIRSNRGIYTSLSLHVGIFRGSDRAARIALSVEVLMKAGWTCKMACVFVAEILETELGQSRRGRPSLDSHKQDLASKVGTVRSLWNDYRKRQFNSIAPLELWMGSFRNWQEWIFWSDDSNFDSLTEMVRKKPRDGAAERFRNAINECKATLLKPEPGDWSWPLYLTMTAYQTMTARGWGYENVGYLAGLSAPNIAQPAS